MARWAGVEAAGLVLELLIASMAVVLVRSLAMATPAKVMVVCAFSAQLLIAVPVAFRLGFLRHRAAGRDAAFDTTNAVVSTQVAVHFSVMAATFPCLRQFLQALDSSLGATTRIRPPARPRHALGLQPLTAAAAAEALQRPPAARLRPDATGDIVSRATAAPPGPPADDARRSADSFGSAKAMIWRTQRWEIRY